MQNKELWELKYFSMLEMCWIPMKLLPWMCQNHMMGSVGALVMGECINMPSILGDEPLKSLAMSILQEQFDDL